MNARVVIILNSLSSAASLALDSLFKGHTASLQWLTKNGLNFAANEWYRQSQSFKIINHA